MRRELQGSRAIVTGASSGIGRALALELARHEVVSVLVARREDRLREAAEQIAAVGGRAELVVGDVAEAAVRQEAVEAARSRFGGLDILVNNAGVGASGLFESSDPQTLRRVMEVNFFALVEMTRLALPLLKCGRKPILVNVSSILGRRAVPHNSEYSASKFAVHGFSESIRAELGRQGIDVLVVSPGTTQTEFFDRRIRQASDAPWPTHTPVSAEEVARQIVRAMRRGRHEIVPYGLGRILLWLNRLSPSLMDRIMARFA